MTNAYVGGVGIVRTLLMMMARLRVVMVVMLFAALQ